MTMVSAGSREVGKIAELAVLSKSYMLVFVDRVGGIESVVTMVGEKVMFAADGFQNLKQ
jgi:predicted amidohydrolase YtcJ